MDSNPPAGGICSADSSAHPPAGGKPHSGSRERDGRYESQDRGALQHAWLCALRRGAGFFAQCAGRHVLKELREQQLSAAMSAFRPGAAFCAQCAGRYDALRERCLRRPAGVIARL